MFVEDWNIVADINAQEARRVNAFKRLFVNISKLMEYHTNKLINSLQLTIETKDIFQEVAIEFHSEMRRGSLRPVQSDLQVKAYFRILINRQSYKQKNRDVGLTTSDDFINHEVARQLDINNCISAYEIKNIFERFARLNKFCHDLIMRRRNQGFSYDELISNFAEYADFNEPALRQRYSNCKGRLYNLIFRR